MRLFKIAGLTLLVIIILWNISQHLRAESEAEKEFPLPTFVCKKPVDTIKIDGLLTETSWSKAAPLELKLASGEPTSLSTTAKILWDEINLYISFVSEDPDIWANVTERDDLRLCTEEVVEVFIDPDGDGRNYVELEVSPRNVILDLFIPAPELLKEEKKWKLWNIQKLQSAVQIEGTLNDLLNSDKEWSAEIAIPLTNFAGTAGAPSIPPKPGEIWRMNFYRIERPFGKPELFMSWSPTLEGGAHTPPRFGKIIFSKEPVGN